MHKLRNTVVQKFLNTQRTISNLNNSITLTVSISHILEKMVSCFNSRDIKIKVDGVRLVGSVCRSLLSANEKSLDPSFCANDLDISIYIDNSSYFGDVLLAEEKAVCQLVKEQTGSDISPRDAYEMFFTESVHVDNSQNSWSLISIGTEKSFSVDIKVIRQIQRHYAFSIDSFEIVLPQFSGSSGDPYVCSTYGDYIEAFLHLMSKRIYTKDPSEIRRGLFRYCLELARGNVPSSRQEMMIYSLIFTSNFYAEFESQHISFFESTLTKFLKKHNNHALRFLTYLHMMISCHPKEVSKEYLETIVFHGRNISNQNSNPIMTVA
eukprot:TRINITY_DN7125_c0_g1_i1.p1 TRINITY_DN7125_c0_g1~~TRINITY_DN7125_c0_g1_i1.p1  ORF type:complete len:322 (-),score=23.40 TRINITY_DN7125_c0_g1_i1:77-1042(-)